MYIEFDYKSKDFSDFDELFTMNGIHWEEWERSVALWPCEHCGDKECAYAASNYGIRGKHARS